MKRGAAVLAILAMFAFASGASAATITVVSADGAGEGFNDPTVAAPVGGNPGTTLGAQRLNAFQHAANIWGACLVSNVTIVVSATMDPLSCTPTSAILGSAGATTIHRNFAGAPVAGVWYCQALANSLFGSDLAVGTADISATFNSNLNGSPGCLGGIGWYYGYDASNPPSTIDFVTVVLHEIGHGLGFQTFVDLATGAKFAGADDTYMLNLEHAGFVTPLYKNMSNAQRITCSQGDPNLRWIGADVTAAQAAVPVTGGLSGGFVRVHAPLPQQPGSSVSHFSSAVSPNEAMEPAYTGPDHTPGLALNLMKDIGWTLANKCTPALTTVAETDTATVSQTLTTWVLQFEATNTGGNTAFNVVGTLIENVAWLSVNDGTASYGNLNAGASSFGGADTYSLDITGWPGGTFGVDVRVTWQDNCGTAYADTITQTLLPYNLLSGVGDLPDAGRWLAQNLPNPFNPSTLIRYRVDAAGPVQLAVFDVAGRRVRTLVDEKVTPGIHVAVWDGRDGRGNALSSGVYFYRIEAGDFKATKRMVLLK